MRARRSIFLKAAERQFSALAAGLGNPGEVHTQYINCSKYSCNNLDDAIYHYYDCRGRAVPRPTTPEKELYQNLFEPQRQKDYHDFGASWWPRLKNGDWDHESRILALLLCAEICRR